MHKSLQLAFILFPKGTAAQKYLRKKLSSGNAQPWAWQQVCYCQFQPKEITTFGEMRVLKFHPDKCLAELKLIFSGCERGTHVVLKRLSPKDEVKLSRKLQGIGRVVERDITSNIHLWETCERQRSSRYDGQGFSAGTRLRTEGAAADNDVHLKQNHRNVFPAESFFKESI